METETLSKVDALHEVAAYARAYREAEGNVETARERFYGSIREARKARATQQEIADRTVADEEPGLSRQRIAQIITQEA